MTKPTESEILKKINESFALHDADKNGRVTKQEFKKLLMTDLKDYYSEDQIDEQVEDIFKKCDKNDDGEISYEEFKKARGV